MEPGEREEYFYEVVTNNQINAVVQDRMYKRKSAESKAKTSR
jgi:hypothetical protein